MLAMDIFETCLNEISLEGLDGVTISTLWLRLIHREHKINVNLSDDLKNHLWEFLLEISEVEFYQLQHEREDPAIFDRFSGLDVQSGKRIAMAPDELDLHTEVYNVKPINRGNVKGSCCSYETRQDITWIIRDEKLSLTDVITRFGLKRFVIVASQWQRERALAPPGVMHR
uniref:General transcription factor 3C polypeptide 1 winged-helix domain-containing protein n=1 Tax=Ciona savignyi TaxID=51511 RepID=H2Y5T9_CIOSA